MRNKKGQFVKGKRSSPSTEFKKGQHWRKPKPYWDNEWLYGEYIIKGKTASQIAKENKCKPGNICYFINKFNFTCKENKPTKFYGKSYIIKFRLYWDKDWLYNEYITKQKTASQIAIEQDCSESNILQFLKKHNINTRNMKEIRKNKHWGLEGKNNGMRKVGFVMIYFVSMSGGVIYRVQRLVGSGH